MESEAMHPSLMVCKKSGSHSLISSAPQRFLLIPSSAIVGAFVEAVLECSELLRGEASSGRRFPLVAELKYDLY